MCGERGGLKRSKACGRGWKCRLPEPAEFYEKRNLIFNLNPATICL